MGDVRPISAPSLGPHPLLQVRHPRPAIRLPSSLPHPRPIPSLPTLPLLPPLRLTNDVFECALRFVEELGLWAIGGQVYQISCWRK